MTVQELLPLLQNLDRADKLQLMQRLLFDLAREDGVTLATDPFTLLDGATYPVWSPYESYEAADILLSLLHNEDAPHTS